MTRRAALLAAAGAAAVLAAGLLLPRGPRRPHIVVLLWDTTRADRLGAYGYGRRTTPWLDSVAAAGVLWERCRAPSPWTLPSHASLFTGLLPRRHGAVTLESPLAPSHRTLAERLAEAGYDTVLLSNNPLVSPESGLAQGFRSFRDVPRERGRAGAAETLEVLRSELEARRSDGDRAGRPLFLFVNLMEPHLPYDPPEEAERPFRPPGVPESEVRRMRRFQFPEDMAHNLGVRPLDALAISILSGLYDGEVLALDGGCAALEALLAKEGVLGPGADGLLVVTSDHGENLGEHGLVDHKLSVADTLLRVPLVARWPGRLEGGRRVGGQVRLQDLFPTLLEAGGAPAGAGEAPRASSLLGGREEDLPQVSEFVPPLSFLAGMRGVFPDRPESTFERFRHGLLAVTAPEEGGRRLKWVRDWVQGDGAEGPPVSREALFDLAADPGEGRDLLSGPGRDPADLRAARRLSALADEWTAR